MLAELLRAIYLGYQLPMLRANQKRNQSEGRFMLWLLIDGSLPTLATGLKLLCCGKVC